MPRLPFLYAGFVYFPIELMNPSEVKSAEMKNGENKQMTGLTIRRSTTIAIFHGILLLQ